MNAYNPCGVEDWVRVGVPESAIADWDLLDLDLELPGLSDGTLREISPKEVWQWACQGFVPRDSIPMISAGLSLEDAIGQRRASEGFPSNETESPSCVLDL